MLARMVGRSLTANAGSSAWALASLAACAALVSMFSTTSLEVGQKMSGALRRIGANAVVHPATPPDAAGTPPDWAAIQTAMKQQGATIALLRMRAATVAGNPVAVVAGNPVNLREMTSYWNVAGRRPAELYECLAGCLVAGAFGLSPGDNVTVAWAELGRQVTYRVVGVADSGDEDDERIFVTSLDGVAPAVTYALLSVPDGERGIEDFREQIQAAGAEIRPLRQIVHGEQAVLEKIDLLSGMALLAVLVLTVIGVSVSVLARVAERHKELALMRAVGGKRATIMHFLLAEHLALGAAASAAGFVLGTLMASAVTKDVFGVSVLPHWAALGATLGVTMAVSLLAGAMACRRALRFQPAMSLRGE